MAENVMIMKLKRHYSDLILYLIKLEDLQKMN